MKNNISGMHERVCELCGIVDHMENMYVCTCGRQVCMACWDFDFEMCIQCVQDKLEREMIGND
jgi:hypothetical protein